MPARRRPYVYRCPGQHNPNGFDLLSLGADGQEGTADDVTNWVESATQSATQPAAQPSQKAIDAAMPVAKAWLALVDDAEYGESWEQAAKAFRKKVPKDQWIEGARSVRETLGRVRSRELINATYTTSLPGAPDGRYVILQYRTRLANRKDAVETVTPMLGEDGTWRVSGYYVK